MRSIASKCFVALVLAIGLACAGASVAYADTTIIVKPKAGKDASKQIQEQLNKAREKATAKNKYIIKVKAGSYKLGKSLSIYSNTTLDLRGVKLKATKRSGHMIKVGIPTKDKKKGYAYKNITILGGNLNNNGNKATAVLVAHAKNVKLKGTSVHNSKDAHLMEVAGVNGFTLDGCKFYDQSQSKKAKVKTLESVQLDILVNTHMKQYRSEVLPTKNVTIVNCIFKNVPRGVGSHTAFLNSYTSNVKILNNTFTKCKSLAIQTRGFVNCLIQGNTISGSPRGIVVETVSDTGTYFSSTAAKEGGVKSKISKKYKKPIANQKIVISGNKIKVNGKDPFFNVENEGIRVSGCILKKSPKRTSQTDSIPKGNYYASGITISNNVIKTAGHGVRLSDARSSEVSGNGITFVGSASNARTGFYGVQLLSGSTNDVVVNNSIDRFCTNGIYVSEKSSAARIEDNTVAGSGKYGIGIEESKATSISNNTIAGAGGQGINVLNGCEIGTIAGNNISNVATGSGMSIDLKSSVSSIAHNTITDTAVHGIFIHRGSTVGSVSDNTIKSAGKYGILSETKSKVGSISGNTVTSKSTEIVVR